MQTQTPITLIIETPVAAAATNRVRDGIAEVQKAEFEAIINELRDHGTLHDFGTWLHEIHGIDVSETNVTAIGIVDPVKLLAQYIASKAPVMPVLEQRMLVDTTVTVAYDALGYTAGTRKAFIAHCVLMRVPKGITKAEATAIVSILRADLGAGALINEQAGTTVRDHAAVELQRAYHEITSSHVGGNTLIG